MLPEKPPPDPALVAETKAWLVKAVTDLRAGEHDLLAVPPLLADAGFRAQQAAEKALKGFITCHNVPFRRIHSLEELGEQCARLNLTLRPFVDAVVPLTEHAWKYRYPSDVEEPPRDEIEHALAAARALFEAVVCRLPQDARP